MAQPISYEDPNTVWLITTKTIGNKLWFVNNEPLEEAILGYLAKYQEIYGAEIFGFILLGNHYHLVARFPRSNKAQFMRAFNAMCAKLVTLYVPEFKDGRLWARRYAAQALPNPEDVEHWWQYVILNAVATGLVKNIEEYPGYNAIKDILNGCTRKFKVFDRSQFYSLSQFDKTVTKERCTYEYTLTYSKLPGFEKLQEVEYNQLINSRLEVRKVQFITDNIKKRGPYPNPSFLKTQRAGEVPKKSKSYKTDGGRPIALSLCNKTLAMFISEYNDRQSDFKSASVKFLAGDRSTEFPVGTYTPSSVSTK